MAMCLHSPKHAKGKCPSASVAQEFISADKAKGLKGVIHRMTKQKLGLT